MRWQLVVCGTVLVWLGGCSTYRDKPVVVQPFPGPVPDASRSSSAPAAVMPGKMVEPAPGQPTPRSIPAQPPRQLADGSKVPAVQSLLSSAERERRAGQLEAAVVLLERAQRLAPQSSVIYQRIAEVRLQQKRPAEAEQLARKGVSFASGSAAQASLWRLIAEARRQQGRHQEARDAEARAVAIEEHAATPL